MLLFLLGAGASQTVLSKLRLSGEDAVCNDGSTATMYFAQGDPEVLVVYFQGGFQCYSQASCDQRLKDSPDLMSSKNYPDTMALGGLLDNRPNVSKSLHNASKIYLPYCSSDVFIGRFDKWGYAFRGQAIVEAAIARIKLLGFSQAKTLVIAGGSAGGRAAAFNIEKFQQSFPRAKVIGFFDSPLWLDIQPLYDTWPGSKGLAQFMLATYNFQPLPSCLAFFKGYQYRCMLTQFQLQFVKQPFFVASSQFDSFINSMFVQTQPPYDFLHGSASHNIRTLIATQLYLFHARNPRIGVFALACYSHSTSLSNLYSQARSNSGLNMDDAFTAWLANSSFIYIQECDGFACGLSCSPKITQ